MQQILSDMQNETINIIMQDVESQVVFVNWALSAASAHCATTGCRPRREGGQILRNTKKPWNPQHSFSLKQTNTDKILLSYGFLYYQFCDLEDNFAQHVAPELKGQIATFKNFKKKKNFSLEHKLSSEFFPPQEC